MLKLMRKNTKSIIWVVIAAFMLWGGYAVSTQFKKEGRVAGTIFGKDISFQEFNAFFRTNQIFSFAGKKPSDDPTLLHTQTWQSLIYSYEGKNQKVNVSDNEVREEVMRLLKDQKIENPTPQFYERWLLTSFGFKPNEFETQLRELLRIQKLVKQFNDASVPEPSKEDLRSRFDLEQNSLNLEIVEVGKLEDAKAFYDKVKAKPATWDALVKEHSYKVQATGKMALDAIINLWQIPQNTAFDLLKQKPGFITEPLPRFNSHSLARLKEIEPADEKKFTDELKKQYTERLGNQKKYERFLKWNTELEKRADLKDYTPQPPAAKPAPEASDSAKLNTTSAVEAKVKDVVSTTVKKS